MSSVDEKLRNKTKENVDNKGKTGGGKGKFYLDFSNYEDVKLYKPQEDYNTIDIIPYLVSTKHHPKKYEIGDPDYILDVWVHSNVGPQNDNYVCLFKTFGLPCPICEERDARLKAGADWKSQSIQELLPSNKAIYNVIDKDSEEDKGLIKIFIASFAYFERDGLLDRLEDFEKKSEQITPSSLSNGRSIEFKAVTHKFGRRDYFKYKNFSFIKRDEPYPEDIIKESYPLDKMLVVPSYEEVRDAFFARNIEGEDEDADMNQTDDEKAIEEEKAKVEQITEGPDKDKKGKAKEESKCPSGHKFGEDCDQTSDCGDCKEEIWKECAVENTKQRRKRK